MESKLCKCGGSRWAESLEDLQRTPGSVSSSLSYATPPVVPVALPEVEVVPESPEPLPIREPVGITEDTGGKGVFTQWVHCEFIVSSESICSQRTHQAHDGFFLKVPINLPIKN